ncbi:UNVERIFIED_CONTAM: hypothetical protein FKN15_061649 [Acipenser sinensis]
MHLNRGTESRLQGHRAPTPGAQSPDSRRCTFVIQCLLRLLSKRFPRCDQKRD